MDLPPNRRVVISILLGLFGKTADYIEANGKLTEIYTEPFVGGNVQRLSLQSDGIDHIVRTYVKSCVHLGFIGKSGVSLNAVADVEHLTQRGKAIEAALAVGK